MEIGRKSNLESLVMNLVQWDNSNILAREVSSRIEIIPSAAQTVADV